MTTFQKFPGAAPPRTLSATAALATTLLLHAGLLGLFQRTAAEPWLLATPALERQLAGCAARPAGSARQDCRLAVAARAREDLTAWQLAAR